MKVYYVHFYFYLFHCSFLSESTSYYYNFLSVWRDFFSNYLRVVLLIFLGFFSLSLVFKCLIVTCFHVNFFDFILFGIYSVSWICKFTSSMKFGKFSAIISSNSFLVWHSLLSSPNFQWDSNVRSLVIVPEVSEALLTFLFFFLLFTLSKFYFFSSGSLMLLFVMSILLLSPLSEFFFFNSLIVFSVL